MHKKGKLDCTIYTVLRLRRGLTMGAEEEEEKKIIAPTIYKEEAQHIPAGRSNQGLRALDREAAPSSYKRETSRHENLPNSDNIGGLTG